MITTRLAHSSNDGRRELTSIWMPGALLLSVVYLHSPWMHKQFYRGEVVFPGAVYVEGGCPRKLAGLPKPWVKKVFIFFSN